MNKKTYSIEIAGTILSAEFNDLADQANGSVTVRMGNTAVLATAVMSKKSKDSDFFPLTVDYEEKFYAAGQILGSQFTRREGKPSDEAILSGRIIDRTIRPLFNQNIRHEIQVVIMVLSIDQYDPDVLGVIAASLALGTSDIPWNGPASAVRIGVLSNKKNVVENSADNESEKVETILINPDYISRNGGSLITDMICCGKDGKINMIEIGAGEISNLDVMNILEKGSEELEKIQEFQKKIIAEIGKKKKEIEIPEASNEVKSKIVEIFNEIILPKFEATIFFGPGKKDIDTLKDEWMKTISDFFEKKENQEINTKNWKHEADNYYENRVNDLIHTEAVNNDRRPDGRSMDAVRPLFAQAGGISPIIHGSGIFYRGGTHVLSALTLGGPKDAQTLDGIEVKGNKHFLHHYNFPPFSGGETGRMGGLNRRMVGHGYLAEKALLAVIPQKEVFPYTIRIVSESMASNGSTSMASVCASSLALMDAGVPISAPVAGIASGLMMIGEGTDLKYKVLTDIQGPEDHHGDMDFKVAGTRKGITAVQMDVKVDGIPLNILKEAFEKAETARLHILDVIEKEIEKPRAEISANAPRIITFKINTDTIGLVIGSGGKTIKEIKEKTGAEITIEDDGTVYVTGKNGSAEKAKAVIESILTSASERQNSQNQRRFPR